MRRPKDIPSNAPDELVPPELVAACRTGDAKAWARLVEATHRDVYTLCLRILRDPDDAAEATQDAFLKAWRGLPGFRGEARFTTWLYRVAANAALSKSRARKRRRQHEMELDDEVAMLASGDDLESRAAERLDARSVDDALRALPDLYRAAVVLRDLYDLSIAEIAAELHISETAAKVRVHRGRKMVKEAVFGRIERQS